MIVGIRLKHLLVSGVLGALHLTFRIGKLFGVILRLLLQPFTYLFQWIFRFAVVPFYKVCVLVSKRLRLVFQTSRNGILLIFTSRYTVHGVFGLLLFLVLANNVIAREIPIDEFGEQSMIVGMVNQEAVAIIETSEGVDFYQESLIKDELGSLDASSAPKESIAPVDREIAEMTQGSIIQPTLTSSEDSQVF
ncbi:MAG: hypothetical protein HYZ08_02025, partial [Candidatus Kerfeldbacteria bacterium]|nr:hypothetical protein [Candidatus Kerfeldbacteria bacterium]